MTTAPLKPEVRAPSSATRIRPPQPNKAALLKLRPRIVTCRGVTSGRAVVSVGPPGAKCSVQSSPSQYLCWPSGCGYQPAGLLMIPIFRRCIPSPEGNVSPCSTPHEGFARIGLASCGQRRCALAPHSEAGRSVTAPLVRNQRSNNLWLGLFGPSQFAFSGPTGLRCLDDLVGESVAN